MEHNCKSCIYGEKNGGNSLSKKTIEKYLHDIRNMVILDKEMINNIRNMSDNDKMNIIITYNNVVDCMKQLLNY